MLLVCHVSEQRHTFNTISFRIFNLEGTEDLDDVGVSGGVWDITQLQIYLLNNSQNNHYICVLSKLISNVKTLK